MASGSRNVIEHPLIKVVIVAAAVFGLVRLWKWNQDQNNPYLQEDKQYPDFTLVKQDDYPPGKLYQPDPNRPAQDIAAVLHFKASKPSVGAGLTFQTTYDDRILVEGGAPPAGKTEFDIVLPRGYKDVPNHAVVRLINAQDPEHSEYKHWDLQPLPAPEKKTTLPIKADPRITAERIAPNMIKVHLLQEPPAPWTATQTVKWLSTAPVKPASDPNARPEPFDKGTVSISTPAAIDQDSVDIAVFKTRQSDNVGSIDLPDLELVTSGKDQMIRLGHEHKGVIPGLLEVTIPAQTVTVRSGRGGSRAGLAMSFKWLQPDQQGNIVYIDPGFDRVKADPGGIQIGFRTRDDAGSSDQPKTASGKVTKLKTVQAKFHSQKIETVPDYEVNIPVVARAGADSMPIDSNKNVGRPAASGG